MLLCVQCDSPELSPNAIVPSDVYSPPSLRLRYPWDALGAWPEGHVVTLTGGPGTGKSTLAAMLKPSIWITTEQTVGDAARLLGRVQGKKRKAIPIVDVKRDRVDPEDRLEALGGALASTFSGLVTLDSVTEIGEGWAQIAALELLIAWTHEGTDRRAVAIMGHTKEDKPAGPNRLRHLGDADARIDKGDGGFLQIGVRKNRGGDLGTRYYGLGAKGVVKPTWPYAYSVEGNPGAYRLVPFPSTRTKWAEPLEVYAKRAGVIPTGIACAARRGPYAGGWMLPRDEERRRKFAEDHGLTWLEVEEIPAENDDKGGQHGNSPQGATEPGRVRQRH